MIALKYIRFYDEVNRDDLPLIGGKNANLAEMYQYLSSKGVNVPFGFATTSEAYSYFIQEAQLNELIHTTLSSLDTKNMFQLTQAGEKLRSAIMMAKMPEALVKEIQIAYQKLCTFYKKENLDVAVRSSATAEDLPDASFAGQQESFLNIQSQEDLLKHIQLCYASLFTDRAISYRHSHGFKDTQVALCVGVQKMVRSDKASSGVMFTIDPDTGSNRLILINSIWGLGENIVGGTTNPDEYAVFKPTLKKGFSSLLKRELGTKALRMVYDPQNRSKTLNLPTDTKKRQEYSISDEEVIELAQYGLLIEEHYTQRCGTQMPMDIEWAKDGEDGKLYIVQARPETVHSKKKASSGLHLHRHKLLENQDKNILLKGTAVGEKIAGGKVKYIQNKEEFHNFSEGDILVTKNTDPDWEPIMKKASALVTDHGGRTCHAAIVAREMGVPALVATAHATKILKDGMEVTINCSDGNTGYVYEGILEYEVEDIKLEALEETKTQLYMNVADPQKAFHFSDFPNQGVGLARMEFIINNTIKAHPNALIDLYKTKDVNQKAEIKELLQEYTDAKEFFIHKISEGVGMIAAAFYPKPVIVRTSDFKSNEYKHMLGGEAYEPDEENPMIGYRGASRYYSDNYKEAFEWECQALKRVRDDMGLSNLIIMLPFVRTPQEGKNVIEIMRKQGLKQGVNGLKVYAMCEIPANIILADEFLKIFDGYSIGSNDLTQLTLGVDRGSHLISHVFDERDEAVKRMITMAIEACKKENKYIGICGQAPSDYPEITEFLVQNQIDSISLNPDSIIKMHKLVLELERRSSS